MIKSEHIPVKTFHLSNRTMLRIVKVIDILCKIMVRRERVFSRTGVELVKLSRCLAGGVSTNQSFAKANDVWKAFGFQCNFIFVAVA